MATLASASNMESQSRNRPQKSFARKCERCCCSTIIYFPLVFVYGVTTWAVWVQMNIGFDPADDVWTGYWSAFLAILLYLLLNWSYTTAVFVDPGSPMRTAHAYSVLPSHEHEESAPMSVTVKSTGEMRFCKKCQTKKPDRAHHCSTCRRCVLKMDHHCPWLATCVGLRNYKPFLLFLIYTSLFSWLAFASSGSWVWSEIFADAQFTERTMPVNYILLAVIGGIIGLVLSGFTLWHIYLACRGQTTIESLEKTRYLTPLKKSMQNREPPGPGGPNFAEQLREIHANTLPGVTRPEEGEERASPAQSSLRMNFQEREQVRERDRYNDYLDEKDAEKLPNAFDLGWRRNLKHVFGERLAVCWLPICNTTGNGWNWDVSSDWIEAKERLAREREARRRENEVFDRERGWSRGPIVDFRASPAPHGRNSPALPPKRMPMQQPTGQPLGGSVDADDRSEGEGDDEMGARRPLREQRDHSSTANWNDLPDEYLTASRGGTPGKGTRSRSPRPRWADNPG